MSEDPKPYYGSIPPILQKQMVQAGSWTKYMRILIFGGAKSGKSTFLASMPKPILAASGGDEQGISLYLDPSQGDLCFEIDTPDRLTAFIDFGMKNMDKFGSIVLDPITPIWADYMDSFGEKFGGEIKGGQWKAVKAPWNLFMRQLKRSKLHVGMSAWINDFYMEENEEMPGVVKTVVGKQEIPKVEKRIPHHVDMILQASIQLDRKRKPTYLHDITIAGGRRPRTVPPMDFYVGKKWTFDERNPTNPWDTIIEPLRAKWQDTSAGAVDFLGIADEEEAKAGDQETAQITEDYALGNLLRVISEQTDLRKYRDEVWPKEIAPILNNLRDEATKQKIEAAHRAKKTELEAGK